MAGVESRDGVYASAEDQRIMGLCARHGFASAFGRSCPQCEHPVAICRATMPTHVLDHYEHGDPLPVYAKYVGEGPPVDRADAITVYVRCERKAGHTGKHLARGTTGWRREGEPDAT
jgi:hypothetical protein